MLAGQSFSLLVFDFLLGCNGLQDLEIIDQSADPIAFNVGVDVICLERISSAQAQGNFVPQSGMEGEGGRVPTLFTTKPIQMQSLSTGPKCHH